VRTLLVDFFVSLNLIYVVSLLSNQASGSCVRQKYNLQRKSIRGIPPPPEGGGLLPLFFMTIEHLLHSQLRALPWRTFVEWYKGMMPEIEAMSAREFLASGIPILAERLRRGYRIEPEPPRDRREVSIG
jgi:hypothetical protein